METDENNIEEFYFNDDFAQKSYSRFDFNFGLNYSSRNLYEYSVIYKEYGFSLENISKYIEQYTWDKSRRESIVNEYKKCFEIEQNIVIGYYNRGDIMFYIKDYNAAILEYSKAIELNPNYDFAYNSRGICKCFLGDYEGGIKDFERSYSIDTQNQNAHFNIKKAKNNHLKSTLNQAILEYDNKNYKEALQLLISVTKDRSFVLDSIEGIKTINASFFFQLKAENPNIKLNTSNPYYLLVDNLISQYIEKTEKNEPVTEDEENAHKLIRYNISSKIGFGKYEGETVEEIIKNDPHYILWCIINLYHFSIGIFRLFNATLKKYSDFYIAVEINIIKGELIKKWRPKREDTYEDDYDYEQLARDTFNAMTDGTLGEYDDFDGDIDDAMTWGGRD